MSIFSHDLADLNLPLGIAFTRWTLAPFVTSADAGSQAQAVAGDAAGVGPGRAQVGGGSLWHPDLPSKHAAGRWQIHACGRQRSPCWAVFESPGPERHSSRYGQGTCSHKILPCIRSRWLPMSYCICLSSSACTNLCCLLSWLAEKW